MRKTQPVTLQGNLALEQKTINAMTRLYCRAHAHSGSSHNGESTCPSCTEFQQYAAMKLHRCPYGQQKPVCQKCPIHCYKPDERELARKIMRFAGPRMLWKHPFMAIRHLLHSRKPVPARPPGKASARHQQSAR